MMAPDGSIFINNIIVADGTPKRQAPPLQLLVPVCQLDARGLKIKIENL